MRSNGGWILLVLTILLLMGAHQVAAQAPAPAPPSSGAVSSSEAHAALQRVLARREFETYRKAAEQAKSSSTPYWIEKMIEGIKWFDRTVIKPIRDFFRWIRDVFKRVFGSSEQAPSANSPAGKRASIAHYLLYIVLIAVALFLIGLLVSRILAVRRLRDTADELDALTEDPAARRKQEPSYWERSLQQAEALWAAGHQREAMRMLYRACLVLLDARGVLRYDESRANGEVLRALRRQGFTQVQQSLRPIVHSFDRSWYGVLPVSDDEFSATMENSRRFREAVVEVRNA